VNRGSDRRRLWQVLTGLGALVLGVALILIIVDLTGSSRNRVASTPTVTSTAAGSSTTTAASTSSSAPPVTLAPAKPPPKTVQFGANVNLLFNDPATPPALIGAQLTALRNAGATIARNDAFWEAAEPQAPVGGVPTFDWAFDDRVAGQLALHGLRWLPILDYSAPWAESIAGQDHSAPTSAAAYATYAGAFAARYGPGGAFWREQPQLHAEPVQTFEIWNEPDGGQFWLPGPQPAAYADLYIAAREAIDAVDRSARVIVGGLTNASQFLPEMLLARPELRGHIDGVAIHPYGIPSVAFNRIKGARMTLTGLGMPSVPLFVTEFGWTTTPAGALDYVPASTRPSYISSTVAALGHLDCGVVAATIYTWYSPEQNPANSQQWYGIDGLTGQPTPDSDAFEQGIRRAQAPAPTFKLCG
jgi:polysaccharide biosynthesis protein PslG